MLKTGVVLPKPIIMKDRVTILGQGILLRFVIKSGLTIVFILRLWNGGKRIRVTPGWLWAGFPSLWGSLNLAPSSALLWKQTSNEELHDGVALLNTVDNLRRSSPADGAFKSQPNSWQRPAVAAALRCRRRLRPKDTVPVKSMDSLFFVF